MNHYCLGPNLGLVHHQGLSTVVWVSFFHILPNTARSGHFWPIAHQDLLTVGDKQVVVDLIYKKHT